jgi:hypothetical protein
MTRIRGLSSQHRWCGVSSPVWLVTRGRAVGFGTGGRAGGPAARAGADGRLGRLAPYFLEHPLLFRQDQEAFVQQ